MRTFSVLVILVLASFQLVDVSYVEDQRGLDDMSSFLSLLQEEGINRNKNTQSADAVKRRKSADDGSEESKREKCKCQDRASKRLRREIRDVAIQNCQFQGVGFDDERILQLSNVTLTPTPLRAPGDLYINFNVDVRRQLPKSIQIDVDVYKYMFDTLPVSVPCMTVRNIQGLDLGSCSYRDICGSIKGTACPTFQSNGLPCVCEQITPGFYSFRKPLTYIIPNVNSIFDVLVKGSYKMRAAFTDSRTKKEFGCIEATWKITKLHKDKDSYKSLFFKQRNQR